MDLEHETLCAIVAESDLKSVQDHRITREMFTDDRNQRIWDLLHEHWEEHGQVPGAEVVKAAYPAWKFVEPDEPLLYYLDNLRDREVYRHLMTGLTETFDDQDQEGPSRGKRLLDNIRRTVETVLAEVPEGTDIDYYTGFAERVLPRLQDRMDNPGYLRGIPTGFVPMDRATGGLQGGQLITMMGLAKSGKSTMLLANGRVCRDFGKTCLFVTFEMTAEEQEDRLTSMISGVDYNHILNGTMTKREFQLIAKEHRQRELLHGFQLIADPSSTMTVGAVRAKVRYYRPAAVFVDGAYLMEDERGEPAGSPSALTNISRGLKRLAQQEDIPVVVTVQATPTRSKGGLGMDSIMSSRSWAQDSDVILGAFRMTPPGVEGPAIMKYSIIGARSGPTTDTFVEIDWTRGSIEEVDSAMVDLKVQASASSASQSHQSIDYADEEAS